VYLSCARLAMIFVLDPRLQLIEIQVLGTHRMNPQFIEDLQDGRGLWVFREVVLAIVAMEANVPDRGCQPRSAQWISYTGAGRGCNIRSRSSPIGSEIARWSLARMLHFEEQRITAEAGNQSHRYTGAFVFSPTTETTSAARRVTPARGAIPSLN